MKPKKKTAAKRQREAEKVKRSVRSKKSTNTRAKRKEATKRQQPAPPTPAPTAPTADGPHHYETVPPVRGSDEAPEAAPGAVETTVLPTKAEAPPVEPLYPATTEPPPAPVENPTNDDKGGLHK